MDLATYKFEIRTELTPVLVLLTAAPWYSYSTTMLQYTVFFIYLTPDDIQPKFQFTDSVRGEGKKGNREKERENA